MSAPQHLPAYLEVGTAPEDLRGDLHAILPEVLGEPFQGFGPGPDDNRLEFLRCGEDETGVPGQILHDRDQLDRRSVLLGQPGSLGQHGLPGGVATDRDEDVSETMHRYTLRGHE